MSLICTQPATGLPVDADLVRDHLRIGPDDSADLIDGYIRTAVDHIERATRTQIMPAEYQLKLDAWPCDGVIVLPKPPAASVSAIVYDDAAGVQQTLDPATYDVDAASKPGRIVLKRGFSWPATSGHAGCVRITFTVGYVDAENVPYLLRQAILILTGHYYENRDITAEIPSAVTSIVTMFKFVEAY